MGRLGRICTTGWLSCRFTCRPLRDRGEDVILLARALLQRYGAETGRSGIAFGAEAMRAIRAYAWPGNVRELQNRVKRAVIMSKQSARDRAGSGAGGGGGREPARVAEGGARSAGKGDGQRIAAQAWGKNHRRRRRNWG